jgi:hypothetical protein
MSTPDPYLSHRFPPRRPVEPVYHIKAGREADSDWPPAELSIRMTWRIRGEVFKLGFIMPILEDGVLSQDTDLAIRSMLKAVRQKIRQWEASEVGKSTEPTDNPPHATTLGD